MALPLGVIILFIVIGCILVLLVIVGIICKKYLRGDFQNKRKIDDADEPLLEDCYDEFTGKHETKKNFSQTKELNSSEEKTADQIRQKYRKDKTSQSSQASSRKGSDSSSRDGGKHGIATSLLEKAAGFSNDSSDREKESLGSSASVDRVPAWQATLIQEESDIPETSDLGTDFSSIESQSPLPILEPHSSQTQDTQPPPPYTQHLRPDSLSSTFAGEASVVLSLKYLSTTNVIIGTIKKLENVNLNAKGTPRDISFHLKLLPKGKHRMKTPWRASGTENLSLTFTMGSIKISRMVQGVLCLRLYGRLLSSRFARPKCYGECTINLKDILGKDGEVEMTCPLTSKGLYKSTEDLRFSTDDELENH
eukprot:TCONS_00035669-protein